MLSLTSGASMSNASASSFKVNLTGSCFSDDHSIPYLGTSLKHIMVMPSRQSDDATFSLRSGSFSATPTRYRD